MNFPKLFHKSNSSIHQLQGSVLDCSIEQIRGNKVIVDTGMRASFVCFRDELCDPSAMFGVAGYKFSSKRHLGNQSELPSALLLHLKNLPSRDKVAYPQNSTEGPLVPEAQSSFYVGRVSDKSIPRVTGNQPRPNSSEPFVIAIREAFAPILRIRSDLLRGELPSALGPKAPGSLDTHKLKNSSKGSVKYFSSAQTMGFWAFVRTTLLQRYPQVVGTFVPRRLRSMKILGAGELQDLPGLYGVDGQSGSLARHVSENPQVRQDYRYLVSDKRIRTCGTIGPVKPTNFGRTQIPANLAVPRGVWHLKAETSAVKKTIRCGNSKLPCVIGVEDKRSPLSGELICSAPKSMEKICKRKLVWTELTKFWHTGAKNRTKARLRVDASHSVPGFILNSVNGGYAVAIAGYIAFLPKSLCLNKKVFIGQWREFAIIGMNPKIANIVVKESRSGSRSDYTGAAISKTKALRKRRTRIRVS